MENGFENGLTMAIHSAVITFVIYLIMTSILNMKSEVAEDRSILIGSLILIYMILFGHNLPININKNIL
jgi:hypothetical protein